MAHGERDYTTTSIVKLVAAKVDLDLPVILIDRFDSANVLWEGGGFPFDYDARLEPGAAYEGDAGLALRTSFAAVAAGETVHVHRRAYTTPRKKVSISTLFRINQDEAFVRSIIFRMTGQYNGVRYDAGFRYRPVNRAWDYRNDAGVWTELLTDMRQDDDEWHRLYYELDLVNGQYMTVETAAERINLLGTNVQTVFATVETLILEVIATNEVIGTRADISIGNVIVKELGA